MQTSDGGSWPHWPDTQLAHWTGTQLTLGWHLPAAQRPRVCRVGRLGTGGHLGGLQPFAGVRGPGLQVVTHCMFGAVVVHDRTAVCTSAQHAASFSSSVVGSVFSL
jgi:hypothetical protein